MEEVEEHDDDQPDEGRDYDDLFGDDDDDLLEDDMADEDQGDDE
jgi:hypothetical protein